MASTTTTLLHLPPKLSQSQSQPILSFPSKSNFPNFHTHNPFPKIPLSSSPFRTNNSPIEPPCPVPFEQQPINEYQTLTESSPFKWALLGDGNNLVDYCTRLFFTGASFALFVGLPVAWSGAAGPQDEPLKWVFGAVSGGILVVTFAVVRMYLGWAYVGNRLFSATVQYEETGWYDGQVWVKSAEVLARDRLLGSFQVKPVLTRLKYTLVTLAGSLFVCALIFINVDGVQKYLYPAPEDDSDRVIYGIYNEESARSFEPDAFCGEPDLS